MKIDFQSSERLKLLRFPLIVGVVFIHAYGTNIEMASGSIGVGQSSGLLNFIRDLISQGIARVSVPLFFLISGFLFFAKFDFSFAGYFEKVKSRISTLVIPLIFWNIAGLLFVLIAQSYPATAGFFSGKKALLASYGVTDFLNAIIGVTRSPIAYQFWFIRDLIVVVLLSPLIHFACSRAPWAIFVTLLCAWVFYWWPVYVPSLSAVFFFYIGALLAYKKCTPFVGDKYGHWLVLIYPVFCLIDVESRSWEVDGVIHNVSILVGTCAVLYITKWVALNQRAKDILIFLSASSFFVFAVHEPLLTVLRKLAYVELRPENDLLMLFLYLFLPLLVISIAVITHQFLRKLAPKLMTVVTGGR